MSHVVTSPPTPLADPSASARSMVVCGLWRIRVPTAGPRRAHAVDNQHLVKAAGGRSLRAPCPTHHFHNLPQDLGETRSCSLSLVNPARSVHSLRTNSLIATPATGSPPDWPAAYDMESMPQKTVMNPHRRCRRGAAGGDFSNLLCNSSYLFSRLTTSASDRAVPDVCSPSFSSRSSVMMAPSTSARAGAARPSRTKRVAPSRRASRRNPWSQGATPHRPVRCPWT